MTDKEKPLKEFILKHPKESGNWIYQKSKKVGLGIRKQNFYGVLREVRDLPEPTIEKREKSIPIKHRIVKPEITDISKISFPTKEGQYGILEIIDDKGNSKWIKYKDKKSLDKQLGIIEQEYGKKKIIFHGFKKYNEFIEKEFREQLTLEGISL